MFDCIEFPNEPPKDNDPVCIRDIVWVLTRPATLSGGGIGKDFKEVSNLSFSEIENLLRHADKSGNPVNEKLSKRRSQIAAKRSKERVSIMQQVIERNELRRNKRKAR